ncbi:Nucleoid occlusion protein [subsurface metagenome]
MPHIQYINLADLTLPKFQSHQKIPREDIQELSDSIKSIGIIEPLIIRDIPEGKEIVAGCLRYHAALLAGLKAVPCLNMSLDPKQAEILKLHENVKRIPLDHVDQGHTFIMMMETFKMTELQISESIGKSISYISQHVSLVKVDNELTKAVKSGIISFSQARELMRVDDTVERMRFLSYCQHDGATVEVLRRWIQDYQRDSVDKSTSRQNLPEFSYGHNDPNIYRNCEACDKSVNIKEIRQVFYCPTCDMAIRLAISEEKLKKPPETPVKSSEDAPG